MENYDQEISTFEKIAILIVRIVAFITFCMGLLGLAYSLLLLFVSKSGSEIVSNLGNSVVWLIAGIVLIILSRFIARQLAKGL